MSPIQLLNPFVYSNPGRHREPVAFSGTPRADCGATPDGGPKIEIQACSNLPLCS